MSLRVLAVHLGHISLHCLELQLSHVWSRRVNLLSKASSVGACAGGCWSRNSGGSSSEFLAVGYPGFHWFPPACCAGVIFRVFHEAEMVRNTDSNDCWVPFSLAWSLIPKFLHLLTVPLGLYMLICGQRTEMPWNINTNKPHLVIAEQIKHMIHSRVLEPFVLIISHFQTPLAPFHILTSKYPGENC